MNIKRSNITSIMTLILSLLALYAALAGVLDKSLYREVFEAGTIHERIIWGSMAQDIISIPIAAILALLSAMSLIRPGVKRLTLIIGLAWYFFYAYGLYTVQGQYTRIYLVYIAIFGLSIYSMIFGLLSFKTAELEYYKLPGILRITASAFLIVMVIMMVTVWVIRISPDIAAHIPAPTYGVYILDLSMVFPATTIIAIMLLQKKQLGSILGAIALLKVFTLCFSWFFGEITGPLAKIPMSIDMAVISGTLSIIGLIIFLPYFIKLKRSSSYESSNT
ncbi:MAG: hypothetical protein ACOZCL_09870 [Bacillota bacterium]